MRTRIVKPVSFSQKDLPLLNWAERQGSWSEYVKTLIARDMKTETEGLDPRLVELMEQMVESRLKHKDATVANPTTTTEQQNGLPPADLLTGLF